MAELAASPCPFQILYHDGGDGAIDQSGVGATLGFHVGEGVGGAATDLVPFLLFVGGTTETVVIGGISVERIVPLIHPWFPDMIAQSVRWRPTGRGIDAAPGYTDWKITVEFAYVPYGLSGDTPYLTVRRRIGATAITLPGRAFAVSSVRLDHDVARVIPEVIYSATKYNVPSMDDSIYKTLAGKINSDVFLGYPAETVRFDGVEDEITMTIGFVANRTVTLSMAWRPVSWNRILLPSGIWEKPLNVSDGLGIYEVAPFARRSSSNRSRPVAGRRRLTSLVTNWVAANTVINEWKIFIERCDAWSWGTGFHVDDNESGRTVIYIPPPSAVSAVAATGGISAASGDTLGSGDAVLRLRTGASLTNGRTVKVYSNFSVAIPAGTRIEVCPDAADFKLVGSDCPA